MLKSRKIRIRLFAAALGAGLLLIPISISPGQETTVEVTDACAGDSCCPEIGSICLTDDGEVMNSYGNPRGCDVQQN